MAGKEYLFTVLFEPQREGGYMVVVPALPEICTDGRTLDEAREMAVDAIKCHCEGLLKDGLPVPDDVDLPEPVKETLQVAVDG
ncbi:MAG: type II toxin-antitoxin system HicB family antitoxin [Candidatus Schekmanbacteria bacterium]|nr:type II toxin-antitoxin system HicB family antitoxin [Candidatus Schekmanbacteria bacterium]